MFISISKYFNISISLIICAPSSIYFGYILYIVNDNSDIEHDFRQDQDCYRDSIDTIEPTIGSLYEDTNDDNEMNDNSTSGNTSSFLNSDSNNTNRNTRRICFVLFNSTVDVAEISHFEGEYAETRLKEYLMRTKVYSEFYFNIFILLN